LHFLFYEHVEELAEAIAELEKPTPTPTSTPPAPKEQEFEAVFAIAGILAVACAYDVVLRRNRNR
jgi:hypothetical protein